MTHSLTLGSLELTGDRAFADEEHGFWFEVAAEGTEFGSPEAITRIITSLLSDGAIVSYDSDANRSVPVRVRVNGPTLAAVAQGEAALRRESRKVNELTWQPPDDFAAASVYETRPSTMRVLAEAGWDLDEKLRRVRTVALTLTCAPFARSATLTTVAPLEVGGSASSVTVDTCDATSGWSGTRSGSGSPALGLWNGGVGVIDLDTVATSPETWTLTRTGSVDFTTTPYLVVQARTVSPVEDYITAYASASTSSEPLPMLSMRLIEEGGWYEIVYLAEGVAPALTFSHTSGLREVWQGLVIRDIRRTNMPPGQTARQVSRLINVGGTERTPGSLHISSPDGTSDLGLVIVSTYPEKGQGFSPPMSRWYTNVYATRTVDATTVSGYRFRLDQAYSVFDVPDVSLPDGGYQMVALARASVDGRYKMQSLIQSRQGGVTLAEDVHDEPTDFAANDWKLCDLGVFTLPVHRTVSGTELRVSLKALALDGGSLSGVTVEAQEVWLFPVDEDCGLTAWLSPMAHVWLEAPTVSTGVPRFWEGDDVTMAGARYPLNSVHTPGVHVLPAGRVGTFVVASGVDYPLPEWSYYTTWHSNVGDEPL